MVRPGLMGLLAVAALWGCGGGVATDQTLDSSLANRLAALSETVAERLDAGDACGARAPLAQLRTRATAAIRAGKVPDELVGGLRSTLDALDASVVCETPTATEPATTAEETDEDEGRDKKHEDKGKGNDKEKHGDSGQGNDDEASPAETGAIEGDG
jgi:hypothetical protein